MKILVCDPIAPEGLEILRSAAEVDVRLRLPEAELLTIVGGYDALVVRSETQVTGAVIEAGRKLQVIGRAGVGVDNIDLEAATRRGILVVNAPASNIVSAAEHALALMLAVARHIPQAYVHLKQGAWARENFIGVELRGKTLGILGLGKVGTEVAKRARALEMNLIGYDPFVTAEAARQLEVELLPFREVLGRADFLTIHTPLTSATQKLMGARELAQMKRGARLINTARGGIVDEEALYQAVESGHLAGAGVDVFEEEPPHNCPLFKSDKIVVTPHLAASTVEAQSNVAVDMARQLLLALSGQPTPNVVNAPLIPREALTAMAPYIPVAAALGSLAVQLAHGPWKSISILYEGDVTRHSTLPLKVAIIKELLEPFTEERVNIVNAQAVAERRGLQMVETTNPVCANYSSLVTLAVVTPEGTTTVAGTLLRDQPHIVRVNDFWIDVVPSGGYWLFSHHRDRPGLIGAVGNVTGEADINISSMQVGRLKPRGQALMILGLDASLTEAQIQKIMAIPDIITAHLVKL